MKSEISVRVKFASYLFPLLTIVLAFVQFVTPYRGWMILLVAFGGIWLAAWLWARSLARGLRFSREMRFGWGRVGDILEERFTLSKRGSLPALWVEVLDQSDMPDYQVSIGTGVSGDSEHQWNTQRVCRRRGVYRLGPTRLRTGDPFGIYTVTIESSASKTLLVLPPIVDLPLIQIAPGGRVGEGQRQVQTFEQTVSVKGVREYLPGDNMSHIHWLSVARHNELYVRLFDNMPAGDWWIYLDMDDAVQVGAGENSTLEQSIILAASLAERGLHSGHSVGLVLHDEKLVRLAPQFGEGQRWEILRALACATAGTVSLAELMTRAHPQSVRHSSLIVITPSLHFDWLEALASLLARGASSTVLLLNPVSFGGTGNASEIFAQLGEHGIHRYLMTREMISASKPDLVPSDRWDWMVGITGRAFPRHKPADERWKELA